MRVEILKNRFFMLSSRAILAFFLSWLLLYFIEFVCQFHFEYSLSFALTKWMRFVKCMFLYMPPISVIVAALFLWYLWKWSSTGASKFLAIILVLVVYFSMPAAFWTYETIKMNGGAPLYPF